MIPDVAAQPGTVSLTIPAKPEFLAFCRLVLTGLAQVQTLEAEELSDLKLAVTEACTNAITHAYDEAGGTIVVRYHLDVDHVDLEIEDHGRGFEDGLQPQLSDGLHESGMGLAIIRSVTDSFEVAPGADGVGSRVRLRKRLGSVAQTRD